MFRQIALPNQDKSIPESTKQVPLSTVMENVALVHGVVPNTWTCEEQEYRETKKKQAEES